MRDRRTKLLVFLTIVFLICNSLFAGLVNPVQAQATETPDKYDPSVCDSAATNPTLSPECIDMIKAFPRPAVDPIQQDLQSLNAYSFWRVGPDAVDEFDGPNGNVVGQIPKGFNYVRATNLDVDGWLQILGGKWIKRDIAKLSKPSFFAGVSLPNGIPHEFAWILDKSNIYTSEFPGGPPSSKTKRVLIRYERVNIFATAKDKDGIEWYMIGPDQWVKHTFVAKVTQIKPPQDGDTTVSGRWVAVDLYEQTLVAYEDNVPVFATLISSGLPKHETNEGLFKVWAKLPQDSMSGATGAPSAYALQFVPFVMYFDESISLHGTYWHDLFGYRQSHGCVNMSISDAHFMMDWFTKSTPDEKGQITNYVYVYSSGKYGNDVLRDS